MKLYEVTNGYMGETYVRVLVIADTKERALILATEEFKEEAKRDHYKNDYYNNLKGECICEDTTKEWSM